LVHPDHNKIVVDILVQYLKLKTKEPLLKLVEIVLVVVVVEGVVEGVVE
jgi:hypothetical protein